MLFTYPKLSDDDQRVLDRISEMRRGFRFYVHQNPRRWTGLLARMTRARALRATNSIEGIHVTAEDALAAVDNEEASEADKETYQSVRGYQSAMNYIIQRCRQDDFKFSIDIILSVHFMICQHDLKANPGQLRPGWVGVRNSETGEYVHEGVDRAQLDSLLHELVEYLNDRTIPSSILRGSMAHLNLVMLHPFSDGNGRTARCLHTAALANEGIINPDFSSIEEYIGRNHLEYYRILGDTGGGRWNPSRDCTQWVRFCITAHYRQARTLLNRTAEFEKMYSELEELVEKYGLQERTTLALLQAATLGRVRNSSYRVSADISNNLASRDLKNLADAGLIAPQGEKRGRYYAPNEQIKEIRRRSKFSRSNDDPYTDLDLGESQQLRLTGF